MSAHSLRVLGVDVATETSVKRRRAPALSTDERRAAIVDAVIPLLQQRGRDFSTKDLAAAAGVAEGTLFRVFADKDSIIDAAVERLFDPEPYRARVLAIDPDAPTEQKVRELVLLIRGRFESIFGIMVALHGRGPGGEAGPNGEAGPGGPNHRGRGVHPEGPDRRRGLMRDWAEQMERLFRPDELAVPPALAGAFINAAAFGARIPGAEPVTPEQLVALVCHGLIARKDTT